MNMNNNLINKRAFTLVEFIIAMSIALLVTTVVSKAILSGTRSANRLSSKVYGQKSVRSAISFIAKDLMAAESITEPAIYETSSRLTIQGSKFKQAAMTSAWSGNPDPTTKFKAAGSSQGVAWTKGKPPVVYVEDASGDPIAQSSGYTLNYEEGWVDFTVAPDPTKAVTADFSTDITITYSLDADNNLKRGLLVIADDVENADIFEREADKMFNIKVISREFELRTTIDASTGSYVIPLTSPTAQKLNSAFFIDENKGWVAGDNGALHEFDGVTQTWADQSSGAANLNNINFADNSTGTVVGNSGTILQYAGGVWTPDTSVANNLTGVFNKDRNSVLAVGVNATEGMSYTYDGAGWVNKIGADGTEPFNGISEYVSDKYAVANAGKVYRVGPDSDGDVIITGTVNIDDLYEQDTVAGASRGLGHGAGTYNPDSGNYPKFDNLTINSGGVLTARLNTNDNPERVEFDVVNTLTVNTGGSIDVTGKGYYGTPYWGQLRPGAGAGGRYSHWAGLLDMVAGQGAGHGGRGAQPNDSYCCWDYSVSARTYNAYPELPTFGSVGGASTSGGNGYGGGKGGGAIRIRATTANISGTIWANSTNANPPYSWPNRGNGGGSGGGIYIQTESSVNLSKLSARGGNGSSGSGGQGGGGGGGRITVSSPISPSGSAILTKGSGGSSSFPSENGTYNWANEPFPAIQAPIIWQEFYDAGAQNLNSITINGNNADATNSFMWVAGNGGTLLKHDSTEASTVWDEYTDANFGNLRAVNFFDDNIGWAVGDAGTILRYDVELDQWFEIPSGTNENLNDVFIYSRDEGYIVGDNGTFLKIGSVRL